MSVKIALILLLSLPTAQVFGSDALPQQEVFMYQRDGV